MGFGRSLRMIAGGIGDVAKKAAPFASFIPVVGPLGSAAIGGIGGALGTANDKDEHGNLRKLSFGRALKHAAGGAAIGGLGHLAVGKLAGGNADGLAGARNLLSAKGIGGWDGAAGKAMDWLGDEKAGKHRSAMLLGAAGVGAQYLGGRQQGEMEGQVLDDRRDDEMWQRRRAEMNDPIRQKMMEAFLARLGG